MKWVLIVNLRIRSTSTSNLVYILPFVRSHPDARNCLKQQNRETHEIRQAYCEDPWFLNDHLPLLTTL